MHEPLNQSDEVISQHEQYAKIALLLFHPFRVHSDLVIDNSYWKKYNDLVITKKFWPKGIEILQNLQDVMYNCTNARTEFDPLIANTVLNSCPEDK